VRPSYLSSIVLAAILGPAGPGLAAQAGGQYPAPVRTISADGGYAIRFEAGAVNQAYYRLEYQGRMVREKGTPFKRASPLDLAAPALDQAAGDVPELLLRYTSNEAVAGGGLLEALGTKELPLSALSGLGLRGTAQLGADIELEDLQLAVGLESPPARIPGLAGRGISNWIVIGFNAERREATGGAGEVNAALGTFRTFAGKAVGWRKSADVGRTAAKIRHDLLELAPTLADARNLNETIKAIPAHQRTVLQQTLVDAIGEAESDAEWESTIQEVATGQADAITDQPTAALYTEWSGWLDLASRPSAGRFRSLFTASLDYWFLPRRDDVSLSLRYELGYERAVPDLKLNQLVVSVEVRL
jgi:hypothetical protein